MVGGQRGTVGAISPNALAENPNLLAGDNKTFKVCCE